MLILTSGTNNQSIENKCLGKLPDKALVSRITEQSVFVISLSCLSPGAYLCCCRSRTEKSELTTSHHQLQEAYATLEAARDTLLAKLHAEEVSWQANLTDAEKGSNQDTHQVGCLVCFVLLCLPASTYNVWFYVLIIIIQLRGTADSGPLIGLKLHAQSALASRKPTWKRSGRRYEILGLSCDNYNKQLARHIFDLGGCLEYIKR